ncbi:hypothetical protein IPA_09650 [Ignicoccus pacificus DSM 13166]|uniref:Uncharacterized protein n=1 Tax=Ignicoccus pacificus DSM 13166 TaxID=940294 RepID=A0A977KC36_9CREN|nr:hypothetical protein IPA_09650 [Ignicoccus pacificus DSM 13166]
MRTLPFEVAKYNNFKELIEAMEKVLSENINGIKEILELLNEKWEGEGAGSASYPGMTVLVDPSKDLVLSQLVPILAHAVMASKSLRSTTAIFKTIFSESELEAPFDIRAIWDGSRVRVVIAKLS